MDFPIKSEPELNIKDEAPPMVVLPHGMDYIETGPSNSSQYTTVAHSDCVYQIREIEESASSTVVKEEGIEINDELEWESVPQGFYCDICNSRFASVKGLRKHYKVHVKNVPQTKNKKTSMKKDENVQCEACSRKMPIKNYSMHLTKKHKHSVQLEKCELCHKRVRGTILLDQHYDRAHAHRELPCNQCQIVFSSKFELHRHIKAVHLVQEPSHRAECSRCGIRFEPQNNQSHLLICKSSKRMEFPFICHVCKKLFKSEKAMVRHMPSHGTGSYECDVCSKIYPALAKMKQHLLTTHFKKTPVIPCKYCPQIFNKMNLYREHIPKCHTKKRTFKCDLCDKILRTDLNLRRHKESVHINIKQFKCEYCLAEFNRKSNLTHHQLVHFKYPFTCDICGKLCKTEKALEEHKIQHSDPNGLECKECLMVFKLKSTLEQHIKFKHSKHEKYSCYYCGKQFSYKNVLMVHLNNYSLKKDCNVRKAYSKKKKCKIERFDE